MTVTNDQALSYVQNKMAEWGYSEWSYVRTREAITHEGEALEDALDVFFTLPGETREHVWTVWLDSNGKLYGEW